MVRFRSCPIESLDKPAFVKAVKDGTQVRTVVKTFQVTPRVAGKYAKELGVSFKRTGRPYGENRLLVQRGLAKCIQCKEVKSYTKDNWTILSKHVKTKWPGFTCKVCQRKRRRKVDSSLEGRLRKLMHDAKLRAKAKHLAIDIDEGFILELLRLQNSKCFYIKRELTPVANNWNTMSLDRKDPNAGYTKDNLVICCDIINRMKSYLNVPDFISLAKLIASGGDADMPVPNIKRMV